MPHRFPREKSVRSRGKGEIVLTHFKTLIPCPFPTKFVLAFTIKRHRIDKIQKSVKMFQFPILGIPRKLKLPVEPIYE